MLQLALSSMLLAQAIQLGSMVLIPMISILCNLIGLSWTTLICAALLVVSVLLVFCASVPEDEPGKALPGNVNGNGLFLAPMSMMSVYFASMKEHPKKKAEPHHTDVCACLHPQCRGQILRHYPGDPLPGKAELPKRLM